MIIHTYRFCLLRCEVSDGIAPCPSSISLHCVFLASRSTSSITMTVSNSHRDSTPGPSFFPGCLSWAELSTDHGQDHVSLPRSILPPRPPSLPSTTLPPPHCPLPSIPTGVINGTSTVFVLLPVLTFGRLFRSSFTDRALRLRKRPLTELASPPSPPSPPEAKPAQPAHELCTRC